MSEGALYFTLLTLCSVAGSYLTTAMPSEKTTFRKVTNFAQWVCLTVASIYWGVQWWIVCLGWAR